MYTFSSQNGCIDYFQWMYSYNTHNVKKYYVQYTVMKIDFKSMSS